MDWSSVNWEYLGLIATLSILVGGFVGGSTYFLTNWSRARRDKRWGKELNDKPLVIEEYDWMLVDGVLKRFPRQRGTDDGA